MKKNTTATATQGAKVATNKTAKPVQSTVIKPAVQGAKVEAKESDYKQQVLNSNAILKTECVKLGYAVKVLVNNLNLLTINQAQKSLLMDVNNKPEQYKHCANNCRKSKNGNYSPFYVLQYLYKHTK